MAVNYFGKRRLEKILFNYLSASDRNNIAEAIKADFKEYGKQIITYKRYRGSEWFEISDIYDKYGEKLICYRIYALTSDKGCWVSMSETHIRENDNGGDPSEKVFRCKASYTSDFYPQAGSPELFCYEICKTAEECGEITSYKDCK